MKTNISNVARNALLANEYKAEKTFWMECFSFSPESKFPMLSAEAELDVKQLHNSLEDSLATKLHEITGGSDQRAVVILLSSLSILMSRYSGRTNVVLGAPFINLNVKSDNDHMPFVFEVNNSRDMSGIVMDALGCYKSAVDNRHYPIECIYSDLQESGIGCVSGLFDVSVGLGEYGSKIFANNISGSKQHWNFNVSPSSINLLIKYDATYYDTSYMRQLMGHLEVVLRSILMSPRMNMTDLDLLSVSEKTLIHDGFNGTKTEYPRERSIYSIFQEQERNSPEHPAIIDGDFVMTYRELGNLARKLASTLVNDYGIGCSSCVAILLDRSPAALISILATLRVGAIYAPVDVTTPVGRIEKILDKLEPDLVITDSSYMLSLNKVNAAMFVYDLQIGAIPDDTQIVEHDASAEDLAYVMFTSGTTGEPKGVMVTHRNVVRLVKNTNYLEFDNNPRLLLAGSLAFDASTFEIWGMLLNGGTLYLAAKNDLLNTPMLRMLLLKNHITHMWFTSAWFNQLVDQDVSLFAELKQLLVGGDVLSPRHINLVRHSYPGLTLGNVYGPTENTTFSTYFKITDTRMSSIPLGRPLSNSTVYIMDANQNILPSGAWGEIVVGGDGVGTGYWRNDDETKAKFFLSDSVQLQGGNWLYRTGDRGRYWPNGLIEFGGRFDSQIKLRGFRIEINEIENSLTRISAIRESKVVLADTNGDKYLCAYVVCDSEQSSESIKNILKKQLPEYMIPRYIVSLPSFPLTVNGKIDIKQLPDPVSIFAETVTAPTTEIEEYVQKLWARLLEVDHKTIGREANFFDIGGHSLKATLFIAQIQKELNAPITLNDVFQFPTLKAIAEVISQTTKQIYLPIPKVADKPSYLASSTQRRMYMIQKMRPDATTYNIPLLLAWHGPLDKARLQNALNHLIERHASLRTCFELRESHIYQIVKASVDLQIQYLTDVVSSQDILARKFIHAFDLSYAPLMSIAVVERSTHEYLLIFNIHHIIIDAVSLDVFINDWHRLYCGETLVAKEVSYVDFSEWLYSEPGQLTLETHRNYWITQYSELPPPLRLPTTCLRPAVQTFGGATTIIEFDKDVSSLLRKIASENNATLFMVLLSIVYVWLNKISGQDDLVVGSPVSGRSHPEVGDIIGMFVNTLPLRNRINPDETFIEFLRAVRANTLNAFDHQDYPFERLVEDVVKDKDLSRNPLFDVMFALQNADTKWPTFEGARLEPMYQDTQTSKFDINIASFENDNCLVMSFEYNTTLFSKVRADSLKNSFTEIMSSIARAPAQTIALVSPLSASNSDELILKGTGSSIAVDMAMAVHHKVAEHARKFPESIAISHANDSLSYGELDRKVTHLACLLVERGVQGNRVIGVHLERSIDLVIAIIAIHKCGGTFLLLDPALPRERIEFMIDDSNASLIITADVTVVHDLNMIVNINDAINYNDRIISFAYDPSYIAYLIYTSGTTGRPKGVRISYGAIANFVQGMNQAYVGGFSQEDKCLCNAKSAFDAIIAELMIPLWYGSQLVINPTELALDVEQIAGLIVSKKITFCYLPLLLLKPVLRAISSVEKIASLNKIFFGAEPIKDDVITECRLANPDMQILNAYGPTENTVCATLYDCRNHNPKGMYLPIGKPMSNINVYVVDENEQLVPEGTVGELIIAGSSLAEGYTDAAETHNKFGAWKVNPSIRIYRTGDLVKWGDDGNIIFMGRRDSQLKLRGIRIEPAEIEVVMSEHPLVGETVVQLRPLPGQEEPSLVAYYRSESFIKSEELRRWCQRRIPHYMVPEYFVQLVNPVTSLSGKIDRHRLPDPEIINSIDNIEARTPTERILVDIWSKVLSLDVDKISVEKSFFDLGGNSLRILNLRKELNARFESSIKVVDLFQMPSIADLAKYFDFDNGDASLLIEDLST